MKNKYIKFGLFAVLGAIAGFSYYYFIGCYSGSCPISSNPYISTVYGAAVGLLMGWDNKKKKSKEVQNS
ncbi:MAG: hypothetical protein H6627_08715 [Calditrichae bacterium]|nr:hypothetical protein [Calditrichota bacterium]MCB9058634.1 hypothetical protein [Calditrichia bacterium]